MNHDDLYLQAAIVQAHKSLREGGIPIGAALAIDGVLVGLGHNRRVQLQDPILHAETDCIRNAGRLTPQQYRRATIYTTLSPCAMCSGTVLLYGIPRVVIAENTNFVGAEDWLRQNGVRIEIANHAGIQATLGRFISENATLWHEDISLV